MEKTEKLAFYYNGIKVNGGKLIKCFYFLNDDGAVRIVARDYADLPRDVFPVVNNTDLYTDYFDDDRADVEPGSPLYPYALYAAKRAKVRDLQKKLEYDRKRSTAADCCVPDFYRKEAETDAKQLEKLVAEMPKDPGQPSADDLAAVHSQKLEEENARRAAQLAEEQAERERVLIARHDGRKLIEDASAEYPVEPDAPVVLIRWSEHPAFYDYPEDTLRLSVAAAERVFSELDNAHSGLGYDKTAFVVEYTDDDGEPSTYTGRYDIGDHDGGLIEHIRSFGRFYTERGQFGNGRPTDADRENGAAILAFADMLDCYAHPVGVQLSLI